MSNSTVDLKIGDAPTEVLGLKIAAVHTWIGEGKDDRHLRIEVETADKTAAGAATK